MAKTIIKITVKAAKSQYDKAAADILALGIFTDKRKDPAVIAIDKKLDSAISQVKKTGDFTAKPLETTIIYTAGKIKAKRILLIGLGEAKKADHNTFRAAAAKCAMEATKLKAKSLALAFNFSTVKTDPKKLGQTIAEGIHFGGYKYDEFVTGNDNDKKTLAATIIENSEAKIKKLFAGIRVGQIIGSAQNYARTLCNRPANITYPATIAADAKKISRANQNLTCTVYDEKQLKLKKAGGILAVGSGSSHKPAMIILKYKPTLKKSSAAAPVALVGKAITFDSGGISIKPSASMDEMKMDMSGGAAVLTTMEAIAKLKLPIEVTGIICAAENIPGPTSFRPGDIVTTYSGKTVEILNTDAEGRMVLCDGIHMANKMKCKTIIDIATLTGACAVALGKYKAGLFSNDDKLIEKIKAASTDSDETVWYMPSGEEYAEEMKSKIADLKNTGNSRYGGACTAAAFLSQFAGKTSWAHIDIAGPMDASETLKKITLPGSIGFGTRLFLSLLMKMAKS